MTARNEFKKATFDDKFDRKFACWVKNNRKAWHYWKRFNRKKYRRKKRMELIKEIEASYGRKD